MPSALRPATLVEPGSAPCRASVRTPLGRMDVAACDEGLVGAWFEGAAHLPDFRAWPAVRSHPLLDRAADELAAYFAGALQVFRTPRLALWGTDFQRRVWVALESVPWGQRTTYGLLAAAVGSPQAVRAAGAAVGRNPWSIMVPCHRVVGANGSLTGYAGGLARKRALLEAEGWLAGAGSGR